MDERFRLLIEQVTGSYIHGSIHAKFDICERLECLLVLRARMDELKQAEKELSAAWGKNNY